MQTVINNILTNYEVLGSNNQKAILIMHGWGQSLENWRIVAKKLAKEYKVFLLDLPGFGGSSVPTVTFGIKEYSEFIDEFVKKMNIDNFILIGHSLGGKIAIKNSVKNSNVERLFLISPSGIDNKSYLTKIKIIFIKIAKIFLFWIPESIKNKYINIFASPDYISAGSMRKIFKKVVDEKVVLDARDISIPSFIIWGENDKEINIKNSKILKGLIKGSTLRILWGTGHSPNIEAPEKLSNLLLEYL